MKTMSPERAMYGTHATMWIDGDEIGEVTSVEATLEAQKEEVKMAKTMYTGYKVTGYQGKGTFKLHKVSSKFIKKFAPSIQEGRQVSFTLISKIDDPDAFGSERVALYGCIVDAVNVVNWEVGALLEEEYSFTFTSYELLDSADE